VSEYRFDRYRNGVRMAEGAKVHAESEAQARVKAAKLFYEHGDEYRPWYPETFVLRQAVTPLHTSATHDLPAACVPAPAPTPEAEPHDAERSD